MLARVYNKKTKRPLLLTDSGERGGVETGGEFDHHGGMPRPLAPNMQQYDSHGGGPPPPPQREPSRSHSSRISRAFGGGRHDERRGAEKERTKSTGGLVKKVFGGGGKKHRNGGGGGDTGDYVKRVTASSTRADAGGVMYNEDDEFDSDDGIEEEEEEEEVAPQLLRARRRFVRSGLTTYEQVISKTSTARRFHRRSYMPSPSPLSARSAPSPCKSEGTGSLSPVKGAIVVDKENAQGISNEDATSRGMSSLSSALQDVINSRPTALKSVVDPHATSARVQRSFVVQQAADGNLFVASKRVPDTTRQTMDDTFVGYNEQGASGATGHPHPHVATTGNPARRSEMDFVYRQKMGLPSTTTTGASGAAAGTAASLLSMSKAGVRRRISGADAAPFVPLRGDHIGNPPPTTMPSNAVRARRSSSSSRIAELVVVNQMAAMFMDHARQRSRSRSNDGLQLPVIPLRKDSAAMLLQRGSFEEVDALPLTMSDLFERKASIDKGPMTFDEFMLDATPAPAPPPFLQRKASGGKSGRGKRVSKPEKAKEEEEDDDDDNAMTRSFRNLKDVDALKRSRSLEEEAKKEKVDPPIEETETEEEYPDYAEERATDDLGSSYEDESAVRNSNITDFLGGFKSRNSMNRTSLAGRNSVGKNDFVARAARSLRNSRKAAQETANVTSELSRKLREARSRVPMDLRGDPPVSTKKRSGFRGHNGKRVRFDMTRYCREFEVLSPEVHDDEVQQWAQRDSEQDDDDDEEYDDDEEHMDDDSGEFGVPIPGAVLAAAMTDANAYYAAIPLDYTHPSRFSAGRASTSTQDAARLSQRAAAAANGKPSEVYM